MHPHNILIFAIALGIAVATPGPGIFAVTSCAIGRGFRDAIALSCGIARRFFASHGRVRLMNRTAGTMMIGSGVAVAVR